MDESLRLLLLVCLATALFIHGRWRFDLVAFFTLMLAVVIGVVPANHAFSGFSHPAVITVAAVMVLSQTISHSGIIDNLMEKTTPKTRQVSWHVFILSSLSAFLSAFMNNTGALALLIPASLQTSRKKRISPSRLLMPLAFASALGGMITLIGTPPNIIISSIREEALGSPFLLFDFAPVGLLLTVICIAFMVVIGWRLLPLRAKNSRGGNDIFQIQNYVTEVLIPDTSSYVNVTKKQFSKMVHADFTILGMIRSGRKKLMLRENQRFKAGDILIIEAVHSELKKIQAKGSLEILSGKKLQSDLQSREVELAEIVIPPNSRLIGRSFKHSRVHQRYNINLIAISRHGSPVQKRILEAKLQVGDVILLQGSRDSVHEAVNNLKLLPLLERGVHVSSKHHTWLPIGFFIASLMSIALLKLNVGISFCLAILGLILTNTLPIRHVYRFIDWSVIMLVAAMIPVGQALETTGATDIIAKNLLLYAEHWGPHIILIVIMALTMVLSAALNNAATTVLMAPIAIALAHSFDVSIDPFLMAVCIGASCSFLSPIGHQNNVLVMGPGAYKFTDYFLLGLPLEVIILLAGVPSILHFWPL